jgi:hypothetical protein
MFGLPVCGVSFVEEGVCTGEGSGRMVEIEIVGQAQPD